MTEDGYLALRAEVEAERKEWHKLDDLANKQWKRLAAANDRLAAEDQRRLIERLIAERQKVAEPRDSAVLHLAMARARLIAEKASD